MAWRSGVRVATAISRQIRGLSEAAQAHNLEISPQCVNRIKQLQRQRETNVALRVTVDGGGCSGFQYAFEIEDWEAPPESASLKNKEDVLFKKDGACIIVDSLSLAYIAGSKVDYMEELISSSFRVVENPNSESSCGCGVSFSPKS